MASGCRTLSEILMSQWHAENQPRSLVCCQIALLNAWKCRVQGTDCQGISAGCLHTLLKGLGFSCDPNFATRVQTLFCFQKLHLPFLSQRKTILSLCCVVERPRLKTHEAEVPCRRPWRSPARRTHRPCRPSPRRARWRRAAPTSRRGGTTSLRRTETSTVM